MYAQVLQIKFLKFMFWQNLSFSFSILREKKVDFSEHWVPDKFHWWLVGISYSAEKKNYNISAGRKWTEHYQNIASLSIIYYAWLYMYKDN